MRPALAQLLARVPARQLNLLLGGALLLVAAALWLGMRGQVQALRVVRAERARLQVTATDSSALVQENRALAAGTAALGHALDRLDARQSADQLLVDLIDEVDRAATRHGVQLSGAVPGPRRKALIFEEVAFDLEAQGSYQALVDWMAEVERSVPNLSIVRFDIRAVDASPLRSMKIRIGAYRTLEAKP